MATKPDKYKPSGKKLLAAKYLADPEFQGTITELCARVGVARSTFYDWIGDDDFRSYVDELIDKYTDSELSRVWKALMRLIDKGDFQAIKLYFELKGKYKGFRECHIQPDWLLMYLKEDDVLVLTLVDTGTHADLFDM